MCFAVHVPFCFLLFLSLIFFFLHFSRLCSYYYYDYYYYYYLLGCFCFPSLFTCTDNLSQYIRTEFIHRKKGEKRPRLIFPSSCVRFFHSFPFHIRHTDARTGLGFALSLWRFFGIAAFTYLVKHSLSRLVAGNPSHVGRRKSQRWGMRPALWAPLI